MISAGASLLLLEVVLGVAGAWRGRLLGQVLPPFDSLELPARARWVEERLAGNASPQSWGRFDPTLGWNLAPGGSSTDGSIHINSAGMRGLDEYDPVRPEGVLRVAAYGDSFTFGDQVADADCYPARLEVLAREHGATLEVFNFGLPAGGTDQALLRFREQRERWPTEVVAIGILLENIGRNVNRYRPRWATHTSTPAAKPRFRLDAGGRLELVELPAYADSRAYARAVAEGEVQRLTRAHDYWYDRPALGPFGRSALVRAAALWPAHRARNTRRLWLETEGEPFRTTLALLEQFHREALESGASAAPILIFPEAEDLRHLAGGGDRYWSTLLDALEARGVPAIDLSGPLLELWRELGVETDLIGVYATPKGHLAPAGNARVARVLLDWLETNGLLATAAGPGDPAGEPR